MRTLPPKHIKPAQLFRVLIQRPRPTMPIAFRLPGAEHVGLFVRAVTAAEFATLTDEAEASPTTALRASRSSLNIAAATLRTVDGRKIFKNGAQIAGLVTEREASSLVLNVFQGLDIASPMYALADYEAWSQTLLEGADHPTNFMTAFTIGRCVDFSPGHVVLRPDRYFGVPVAEITDGQWMAYRASREIAMRVEREQAEKK